MKIFSKNALYATLMVIGINGVCHSYYYDIGMTIGPTLHFQFGGNYKRTVFGLEFSYWRIYEPIQIDKFQSVDVGIEFKKGFIRVYSEIQGYTGLILEFVPGVSVGPVIEYKYGEGIDFGIQGSLWSPVPPGVILNLRVRKMMQNRTVFMPGALLKVPIYYTGGLVG
jgi:hypothetical protein